MMANIEFSWSYAIFPFMHELKPGCGLQENEFASSQSLYYSGTICVSIRNRETNCIFIGYNSDHKMSIRNELLRNELKAGNFNAI